MASSFEKLVEATPQKKFKSIRKEFSTNTIIPISNDKEIRLREQIDRGKLEYIVNHPEEFDLSSRTTRNRKLDKEGQLTLLTGYLSRTTQNGEQTMGYYQ